METTATVEPRVSHNLIERLSPVNFIDADGANREIFTFQNKRGNSIGVIFYTREELPFSEDAVRGKYAVILGEPPRHRARAEWDEFVNGVKTTSDNRAPLDQSNATLRQATAQNRMLYFVENTPVHLLDLAFHLGLEGNQWRDARQKAALEKVYTADILNLIDDAIAGTTVDDNGNLRRRENQQGEALAVLALLGDKDARETLDKKRGVLATSDEKRVKEQQEFRQKKLEDLGKEVSRIPDGFGVTHITSFKPEVTDKGILIRSSFDGTNGVMTRTTVHFTLGGPITSGYGGGGWEEMPYMIRGDLSRIRDANGNPVMINPVDTYFMVNPGQPLLIPEGHLTMPGQLPNGAVRAERGNLTIYKDKEFTPEDIDRLFTDYYDNALYIQMDVQDKFRRSLSNWLRKNDSQGAFGTDEAIRDINRQTHVFFQNVDPQEIFRNLRTVGVRETLDKLLQGNSIFDETDKNLLTHRIEQWLATKARNASFDEIVYSYGDYLSSGGKQRGIEMLAASWGTKGTTRSQAHSENSEGGFGLTNAAGKIFDEVRRGKERMAKWEQEKKGGKMHELKPSYITVNLGDQERVDVEDRTSIMRHFRKIDRIDLGHIPHGLRPELRRMMFVAGVI